MTLYCETEISCVRFIFWRATGNELSLIHISEPTRQAEISYAVFCLKKKILVHFVPEKLPFVNGILSNAAIAVSLSYLSDIKMNTG